MNIALINPPYRKAEHILKPAFPMGLGYIKAVCKENQIYCQLFDFSETECSDEVLIEKYKLDTYEIIGISSFSPVFDDTVKFIRKLKKKDCTILVGGHHASMAKEKILQDFAEIDYGLVGFGEYSFLRFIQNFKAEEQYQTPGLCYRSNGGYEINEVDYSNFDLNKIPFPDRTDIIYDYNADAVDDVSKRVLNISSSRGCPYSCTYCVNCKNNFWLKRDVNNVIEEIEMETVRNKQNYDMVNFIDCNFLVDAKRAYEIVNRVLLMNNKITVNFQTRSDQIVTNKNIIEKLLATKRCNIVLGIESNSNSVLKRYRKGTDKLINQVAVNIIKDCKIKPFAYIIMFEALESLEDIRDNFDFIKSNNLLDFGMISNIYQTLIPFYGSQYHKEYGEYYSSEIHSTSAPLFVDKRVESLYKCVKKFQNEYQDRINERLMHLSKDTHENEYLDEKNFLIKFQYMVFEYLLVMCEKSGKCFYDILKESKLCIMIDKILREDIL